MSDDLPVPMSTGPVVESARIFTELGFAILLLAVLARLAPFFQGFTRFCYNEMQKVALAILPSACNELIQAELYSLPSTLFNGPARPLAAVLQDFHPQWRLQGLSNSQ